MLNNLVVLAGLGQLALAFASLWIPRALHWREETARLGALTRRVFWVYAAYILATNVALGLVCLLAAGALVEGSGLARGVAAYGTLYWGARVLIQVTLFRGCAPPGVRFKVAEAAMLALFVYLTAVFAVVALW